MVKNMRKSTSATAVINVLRHWFGLLGIPTALRMDGGPQFKAAEFYSFCEELNIDCDASSPYNSQSNGHAEATVKNMKYLVSKLDNPNALVNDLDLRLLEWRNTPRGSDGLSPAERMFNRRQRTQLPACEAAYDNISAEIKEKDDGKEDTDVNVAKATKKYHSYRPGDKVVIQNPTTRRWSLYGTVVARSGRSGRTYSIEKADNGRMTRRNRRFLRPRKFEADADIECDNDIEDDFIPNPPRRSPRQHAASP